MVWIIDTDVEAFAVLAVIAVSLFLWAVYKLHHWYIYPQLRAEDITRARLSCLIADQNGPVHLLDNDDHDGHRTACDLRFKSGAVLGTLSELQVTYGEVQPCRRCLVHLPHLLLELQRFRRTQSARLVSD